MSEDGHDLATEFPELKPAIHKLKVSSLHFRELSEKYHELNKSIHRSEQRIDLLSQMDEEKLRKERLKIKDSLYKMLLEVNVEE